eukprot:gnl/TRDRNA2_/TRDRNA2_85446_c0_seq2.p1 gnl/TRDRNA2_/TRDRNA2_85446_c0~~gnl/TRDRNA2_/TRDRNA2_85446_c0_seq2.p1  ORF type:complete len:319 (+),score=40.80 gnl/TRDRNA2_/TRDRNA2_85446_c0_seq2:91-1047(+)
MQILLDSAAAQEEGEAPTVIDMQRMDMQEAKGECKGEPLYKRPSPRMGEGEPLHKRTDMNQELKGFDMVAVPSASPKTLELRYWQRLKPIHWKTVALLSVCLVLACLEYALALKGDPTVTQARLEGFQNTWWTSSLVLCPSNMEYRIADALVPTFFKLGFTPNSIVVLNCCIRGWLMRCYASYRYKMLLLLLTVVQVLDAADGELARRYGMTSELGAVIDHTTDNIFSVLFMSYTVYLMACHKGVRSYAVYSYSATFVFMCFLAPHYEKAMETHVPYQECSIFAVLGMYQCLNMLYIEWFLTIFASYLTDWVPHQSVD